jgi:porin
VKAILKEAGFRQAETARSLRCKRLGAFIVAMGASSLFGLPTAALSAGPDDLSIYTNTVSFWDQQYMLGNWGGWRSRLADLGVTFDILNIGDLQADVSGSQPHHATYFSRFRASADIDFNKLSDFDGEFYFSAFWQFGGNLSGRYLHVNTLTSSIAGENTERIDQIWYQQGLLHDLFKVKIGQLGTVNEFGATDFSDILFNDELGYAPNALFNARQSFSPACRPGVVLWSDLSAVASGLYAKAGAIASYDNPYRPDRYGVGYEDYFNHGLVASFEIGYQEPNDEFGGVYKLGINLNPMSTFSNPATGQHSRGDFTVYGLAEKTVYHPTDAIGNLELHKGLDLLFEFVGAPSDRNAFACEVTAGARYTGLIPGRDLDKTGFGFIYSKNSSASSQAYDAIHGHGLGGEATLEIDYQMNPTPWFSIQIDDQYIINPGGDAHRSGINVIGLRTVFHF